MRGWQKSWGLVLLCAAAMLLPVASAGAAEFDKYALESASASLSTTEAGAHPDFTTVFTLKVDPNSPPDLGGHRLPYATTRNIKIEMPPGLLGNLNAVDQCKASDFIFAFEGGGCPFSSQIGITKIQVNGVKQTMTESINLMRPPIGAGNDVVARLGFWAFSVPVYINVRVRSDSDYGLTAELEGIASNARLLTATTTIWGVPGDSSHNNRRLLPSEWDHSASPQREFGRPAEPFFTNPTSCGEPLSVSISTSSYQSPDVTSTIEAPLPAITDCEALAFEPSFEATPTSHSAGAPTGLDVTLKVPQNEAVGGRATAQLRDATVAFPKGMTIAPGAGDGLEACTSQQAGYKELHPAQCPLGSKIGSASFDVPALNETLEGGIYQRTSEPGRLVQIWLIADDQGAHVALPGAIELDSADGQITSVFLDNPQVPLRELQLHLKLGPRAPLANPPACGSYATHFQFAPWSGNAPAAGDAPMTIDENCAGRGGFSPKLSAGTSSLSAGSFASFLFNLTRQDGEQNVAAIDLTLPQGLLAKLAGTGVCGDAEAASGNCPASSQIGTTALAVGPGSAPLGVPQPGKAPTAVYLAGPYKGAPYSLVVKVPAQAGPFDLGIVAVRSALYVDPESAQVTVKSDPLPQILQGIPVAYRSIRVNVDRPGFTLNPTDCEAAAVNSRIAGSGGAVATPSSRFQVGECGALGFAPRLALALRGATARSGYPALKATLTARPGDANIGKAVVALPHSEFLAQDHIGTICTRVQFAAKACPPRSVYGRARAISPLLDSPLEGPVYLRSSSHSLPDLVVDLNGQINVVLVGRIDSVNGGIRSSFETVPDAPVTKFVLEMAGGKKGLLENSRNLCRSTNRATVNFTGQNGKASASRPVLTARNCKKAKKAKAKKRH